METRIAEILLDLNAVALRLNPPFTWASGRLSPIYCDNRLIISSVEHRREVANAFVAEIETAGWQPDVIAGTATAGIPHAAFVADRMSLPMIYVRGASKGHGKENRIEGRLTAGQKVVLIEDLISTGKSSIAAAQGVRDAGGDLLGVAAIFTYGLPTAVQQFSDAGIPWRVLSTFAVLQKVSVQRGTLSRNEMDILARWQQDPLAWSVERGGAG